MKRTTVLVTGSLLTAFMILAPAPAAAQNQPQPTCDGPEYRQFDFWIGEWDVTVRGQPAGTSVITSKEKGCLIHEQWTSAGGGTGQSMNFYDRTDGKWHQVWVASNGSVLRFTGALENGALAYASQGKRPDGAVILHRLVFTPNADGSVRQHRPRTPDAGTTCTEAFDGLYRTRPATGGGGAR